MKNKYLLDTLELFNLLKCYQVDINNRKYLLSYNKLESIINDEINEDILVNIYHNTYRKVSYLTYDFEYAYVDTFNYTYVPIVLHMSNREICYLYKFDDINKFLNIIDNFQNNNTFIYMLNDKEYKITPKVFDEYLTVYNVTEGYYLNEIAVNNDKALEIQINNKEYIRNMIDRRKKVI